MNDVGPVRRPLLGQTHRERLVCGRRQARASRLGREMIDVHAGFRDEAARQQRVIALAENLHVVSGNRKRA